MGENNKICTKAESDSDYLIGTVRFMSESGIMCVSYLV